MPRLPRHRKSHRLALAAGALGLLVGCSQGAPPAPSPGVVPPRPAAQAKPPAPAPGTPPAPPAEPVYAYEAKGRRDPFVPLVTPKVAAPAAKPKGAGTLATVELSELKLSGIIWDPRGYYALVETPSGLGYVLRVNDTIGPDARVARITKDRVVFEVKGKAESSRPEARTTELRMRKEE